MIQREFDPLLLDKARRIRVLALDVDGVLTDGQIYYDHAGNEMKAFCSRDGLGMKAVQRYGIRLALISGRSSPVVAQRARELGVDYVFQGRTDKRRAFAELLEMSGVTEEQVCFAGDDWIDIPVLERAGLAITVPGADPLVSSRAHWVTSQQGGRGAVREICDLILHAQGHDRTLLAEILGP